MGYRWVILAAGTLAQSSFAAVSVGLPALAPALQRRYELSLGETGVVLGAIGIGMLFTLLPWGLLADRIGERLVIALGLTGGAGALVAAGGSHGYAALVGWLLVSGALGASVNAASGRAVMGWFERDERGLALGIRQTSVPIGGAAAAAGLPWLSSLGGTRLAFFALAAGCAVGAAVAAALMREPPSRAVATASADVREPLRDARMWLLGGGSSLYLFAQMALTTFVVLFLHEHRGLTMQSAAAVLAAINVIGIAARIAAGRWSDRVGSRLGPLRLVGLLLAVGMLVVATLVDAPLAVLVPALVVAGVIGISWNGLSFTATAELAGLARSGAALGFQQTLLGVVTAGFPPAFAAVVGATSWRTAFLLSTLGPAVGLVAIRRVREPSRGVRTPGTSAIPPAAP